MSVDLFGNERPEQRGAKASPVSVSLFDAAAERNALASGRPKSQERAAIVSPDPSGRGVAIFEEPTCSIHGNRLLLETGTLHRYACPRCEA